MPSGLGFRERPPYVRAMLRVRKKPPEGLPALNAPASPGRTMISPISRTRCAEAVLHARSPSICSAKCWKSKPRSLSGSNEADWASRKGFFRELYARSVGSVICRRGRSFGVSSGK
jgi:hypothetical protein